MIYTPKTNDFWELQKINNRKFKKIFAALIILYILYIYLILLFFFGDYLSKLHFFIISIVIAINLGYWHWYYFNYTFVDTILSLIKKSSADKRDLLHKQIINIVDELKIAAGYNKRIDIIIIQSLNKNIFVLSGGGFNVICLTEAIIGNFTRDEIQAMLAQQISLLISGDTKILSFISSIYSFYSRDKFNFLNCEYNKDKEYINIYNIQLLKSAKLRKLPRFFILLIILKIIKITIKLLIMAISRNRHYFADAKAVEFTRNPLALAQGLHKISQARGSKNIFLDNAYSPIFIIPPENESLNEKRGLFADMFSTHPPTQERIEILLKMCKLRFDDFIKLDNENKEKYCGAEGDSTKNKINQQNKQFEMAEKLFYVYTADKWRGPYSYFDLFALPNILLDTFINIAGSNEILQIKDIVSNEFQDFTQFQKGYNYCPRCWRLGGRLIDYNYEFAAVKKCNRCGGYLVSDKSLLKILNRKFEKFDENLINEAKTYKKFINKNYNLKPKLIDGTELLNCPQCSQKMMRTFINYTDYIVVDRCNICQTIWFDKNELEYLQIYYENINNYN